MKVVTNGDEPTENYHPNVQFPSALSVLVFHFSVLVLRPTALCC